MKIEKFLDLAKKVWEFLRGAVHFRFAVFLVSSGIFILLGGLPLLHIILIHLFEFSMEKLGHEIGSFWDNAIKILGFLLVFIGIYIYLRGDKAEDSPEDMISFSIPEGWTFKNTIEKLCYGKIVYFEGFTKAELNSRLIKYELQAKNLNEAVNFFQSKSLAPSVPPFEVIVENSTIKIRKKNVQ